MTDDETKAVDMITEAAKLMGWEITSYAIEKELVAIQISKPDIDHDKVEPGTTFTYRGNA